MLEAIIEELTSFEQMVDPKSINPVKLDWNPSIRDFQGYHISVSTPAFQSSVNSGNFSLLPSKLQTQLGNLYLTLDDCKLYNDQALNFYSTPIFSFSNDQNVVNREATRICTNFNDKISKLRGQIKEILPKLESEKIDKRYSKTEWV